MDELSFEEWWQDFVAEPAFEKDSIEAVRRLRGYISHLQDDKREAFCLFLAQLGTSRGEAWWLALSALEDRPHQIACAHLLAHARASHLHQPLQDEEQFRSILRVLAHCVDNECQSLIEKILLEDPIGPFWTAVPWALWPHAQRLFARSWARYFRSVPEGEWRHTAVVQAFISRSDSVRMVRAELENSDPLAWNRLRAALLDEISAPWLSAQEQAKLVEVCGRAG